MSVRPPALLALADGTVFRGESIGAPGASVGEVVFNTAMTGYQEILTDPSYCRQIVTLTYPHIGNTGVNTEDVEADRVHAAGLVIRDLPLLASNWRRSEDLAAYLLAQNVVAIAGIDTRKLTRILREKGAQSGCLMAGTADAARALERARAFPGLGGDGSGEGGELCGSLQLGRGGVAVWDRVTAARTARACTSWPSTTASSATSCASWPRGAAN